MSRLQRLPLLLACTLLSRAVTASVVTYMDTPSLVRLSPVIVHARVVSVTAVLAGDEAMPYTDVHLAPIERIRGGGTGDRLAVRLLGGRVGERAAHVFGVPVFHSGEEVVVFARPTKKGWLTVTGLFQGRIVVERQGAEAFAVRGLPADVEQVRVLGGTSPHDSEPARQPLETWLSEVRELAASVPAIDTWNGEPSTGASENAGAEAFTLLLIPLRRFEPDSEQPIVYRYNPTGAPAVPGGARTAFANALSGWNAVTGHAAVLEDGGDTQAQCYLTFDGITGVSHDDPCGEVPAFDAQTCKGVLAIGGMSEINPFSSKTVNGRLFLQGVQADIVLNSDAECFFTRPGNYEEVLSHEIGHTLGLGHSCGDSNSPDCGTSAELDEAQMRARAHGDGRGSDLRRDDVKGVRFIYPPSAFVELRANGTLFGTGETLAVDMDLNGTSTADFWLFVILPGGRVTGGLAQRSLPLAFYPDLALLRGTFTGQEPAGTYYVLAILGRPGSDLSVASDVLSSSYVGFAFVP